MSKFQMLSLVGKGVTPGKKVTSGSKPEIITDLGLNKFTMSAKAGNLMGLKSGDYIYIIDNGTDATDANDRFYLAKGFEANGKMQGAKLAATTKTALSDVSLAFSYSPTWGAMLYNDLKVSEVSPIEMEKSGITEEYTTTSGKTNKRALKRAYYDIVPVLDENNEPMLVPIFEDEDGEIIECEIFQLTNLLMKDVTPLDREEAEEVTEVEDAE